MWSWHLPGKNCRLAAVPGAFKELTRNLCRIGAGLGVSRVGELEAINQARVADNPDSADMKKGEALLATSPF